MLLPLTAPKLPRQFWLLFWGTLVSSISSNMWFPFVTLFLQQRLGVSMASVGGIFTLFAVSSLVARVVGGSLADRVGRKPIMFGSLLGGSVAVFSLGQAETLPAVATVAFLAGFFGPMFEPASSAMVADLVEPERRAEAYGLLRIAFNVGLVLGPTIGGLIAAQSYLALFTVDAAVTLTFGLVILLFTHETRPTTASASRNDGSDGGYRAVLSDRPFLALWLGLLLVHVVISQFFTTLPVYLKQAYGLIENQYGLLAAINAALIVTLQFPTSQFVARLPRFPALALGATLIALGFGAFGLAGGFLGAAAAVVVLTAGEMALTPVAMTLVAELAPPHLRARYLAAQGITFGLAFGIGPLAGGALLDALPAGALWTVALATGLLASAVFLVTGHRLRHRPSVTKQDSRRA